MTMPLELRSVTKTFGSVKALDDVSLHLRSNEVLGLIGQNGSGKSTLMKLIAGLDQPTEGTILLNGAGSPMPHVSINGSDLFYELSGPEGAPVVAFSNSLGTTLEMWDDVVSTMRGPFRCLRYDTRGHGRSTNVGPETTIDELADDLLQLLDNLRIPRVHLVGLSLGGMIAQALAIRHPQRLDTLVLAATAAFLPPREAWLDRPVRVREGGMAAIVDAVAPRWFTSGISPKLEQKTRERFLLVDRAGYGACCHAIADMDLRPLLGSIVTPTLVVAGAEDPTTPVHLSEDLRRSIPGAEMVVLARAAHFVAVERPEEFASYLTGFIRRHLPLKASPHHAGLEAGLTNRRSMLGAEHVEGSLAGAGPFSMPWQDFISRYAWAEIWGDPSLPWKTRSLVTLANMIVLNREEEFKLHLRPALRNGVTPEELRALFLQVGVYAGVPAANAAFRWAAEELVAELA